MKTFKIKKKTQNKERQPLLLTLTQKRSEINKHAGKHAGILK